MPGSGSQNAALLQPSSQELKTILDAIVNKNHDDFTGRNCFELIIYILITILSLFPYYNSAKQSYKELPFTGWFEDLSDTAFYVFCLSSTLTLNFMLNLLGFYRVLPELPLLSYIVHGDKNEIEKQLRNTAPEKAQKNLQIFHKMIKFNWTLPKSSFELGLAILALASTLAFGFLSEMKDKILNAFTFSCTLLVFFLLHLLYRTKLRTAFYKKYILSTASLVLLEVSENILINLKKAHKQQRINANSKQSKEINTIADVVELSNEFRTNEKKPGNSHKNIISILEFLAKLSIIGMLPYVYITGRLIVDLIDISLLWSFVFGAFLFFLFLYVVYTAAPETMLNMIDAIIHPSIVRKKLSPAFNASLFNKIVTGCVLFFSFFMTYASSCTVLYLKKLMLNDVHDELCGPDPEKECTWGWVSSLLDPVLTFFSIEISMLFNVYGVPYVLQLLLSIYNRVFGSAQTKLLHGQLKGIELLPWFIQACNHQAIVALVCSGLTDDLIDLEALPLSNLIILQHVLNNPPAGLISHDEENPAEEKKEEIGLSNKIQRKINQMLQVEVCKTKTTISYLEAVWQIKQYCQEENIESEKKIDFYFLNINNKIRSSLNELNNYSTKELNIVKKLIKKIRKYESDFCRSELEKIDKEIKIRPSVIENISAWFKTSSKEEQPLLNEDTNAGYHTISNGDSKRRVCCHLDLKTCIVS